MKNVDMKTAKSLQAVKFNKENSIFTESSFESYKEKMKEEYSSLPTISDPSCVELSFAP